MNRKGILFAALVFFAIGYAVRFSMLDVKDLDRKTKAVKGGLLLAVISIVVAVIFDP